MKGRVLWSKAMMSLSRLPLSLSFFFFVGFWPYRPCNYDNIIFYFLQCISFPLMTNFELCMSYVYVCCLCLCNAPYLWPYE